MNFEEAVQSLSNAFAGLAAQMGTAGQAILGLKSSVQKIGEAFEQQEIMARNNHEPPRPDLKKDEFHIVRNAKGALLPICCGRRWWRLTEAGIHCDVCHRSMTAAEFDGDPHARWQARKGSPVQQSPWAASNNPPVPPMLMSGNVSSAITGVFAFGGGGSAVVSDPGPTLEDLVREANKKKEPKKLRLRVDKPPKFRRKIQFGEFGEE